jgi:FkbM family methyltransferase
MSPVLGKKLFQYFFEKLFLFSLAGMNYGWGSPSNSGERFVLEYINSKFRTNLTIFDIGANKGEYTEEILEIMNKKPKIYIFEPLRAAYSVLGRKFTKNKQVKIFNLGFSDKFGKRIIYFDESASVLASLYQRKAGSMGLPVSLTNRERINLTTIDLFCTENKISHIDLLKIDTEGHELKVLQGAKKMLEKNKVGFIQFEFAGTMIDSRTFFRDIYSFLNPTYKIYRILQDGLREIKNCDERQEIFLVSNFLAINRSLNK